MGELTFRCPYTNRILKSGIEIARADALKLRAVPIRIYCPHCGCSHDGTVADGELREAA